MAAFFDQRTATGGHLNNEQILAILGDGNISDIEDFDEIEEFHPNILEEVEDFNPEIDPEVPAEPRIDPAIDLEPELEPEPQPCTSKSSSEQLRRRHPIPRKRVWKQPFQDISHDYASLPPSPMKSPMEYFSQYFDREFLEHVSRCTNLYHLRRTGRELKSTATDIAKVFSIHVIIGCIPYPRLSMYWRSGFKIEMITKQMSQDQFLIIRNALHVVDTDEAPPNQKNPLWKVQPMIDKVKMACNRLERGPGFYSIDEQMIPFTGRCKLRQVIKNKPRPVGLKNFVLITSDGLMMDFDVYRGAKTMFGDTTLGLGPSVVLHLIKSIPPGSCVYHDRYFTTVPLIEEMHKRKLHSTGTIMINRIPDRAAIKFKADSAMARGESHHYVCKPTVIVKWKDNKSVLMASNCTGSSISSVVKRWNKFTKSYVDVSAPKVVKRYNQRMTF